MLPLTPGLRYLAGAALSLAIPAIGGVAIQLLLNRALDARIPTWIVIFGSLVIVPVEGGIRLFLKEWRDRQEAAVMGAQLVPKVRGKLLGNLDVVRKVREAWTTGYPGACSLIDLPSPEVFNEIVSLGDVLDDFFDFHGSMFNLYPVYSDLFFTMSPEHLKLMLTTDFPNFVKGAAKSKSTRGHAVTYYIGERLQESLGPVLGSGILITNGTSMHPPFSFLH